jgi:TonB family protein
MIVFRTYKSSLYGIAILMRNLIVAIGLLFILAIPLSAQTCDFYPFIRYENASFDVENLFGVVINTSTNQVREASRTAEGRLLFSAIQEGNYLLVLRAPSHMTTVQNVFVDCAGSEGLRRVVSTSYACRGNEVDIKILTPSRAKVLIPNRYTAVGSADFVCSDSKVDPQPTNVSIPKQISGGVLNSKALYLPKPNYPPAAKAVRASGPVTVEALIDENGNVISATALTGHPLLRASAVEAARKTKFAPTLLSGNPVKVKGVITFNFVEPDLN